MYYYIIVALVAIVFFIAIVVYMNYSITTKKSSVYPPIANTCPDFWLVDMSGNCIVPSLTVLDGNRGTFTKQLASKSPQTFGYVDLSGGTEVIDFNHVNWGSLGSSTLCNKNKWANTYGIAWDGVSNYTGKC